MGEKIYIGDDVVITVIKLDRGQVDIGVKAPKNTSVDREEIYKRKLKERNNGNTSDNSIHTFNSKNY